MDASLDVNSGIAVTAFAMLYAAQLVLGFRERRAMRQEYAERLAVIENDRRALTAAAMQHPNPIAAAALRRNDMRAAETVERVVPIPEGL